VKLAPVPLILGSDLLLVLLVPGIIRLEFWTGLLQHPRTIAPFPTRLHRAPGRDGHRLRAFTRMMQESIRGIQQQKRLLFHRPIHLSQIHNKRPRAARVQLDRRQGIPRAQMLLVGEFGKVSHVETRFG